MPKSTADNRRKSRGNVYKNLQKCNNLRGFFYATTAEEAHQADGTPKNRKFQIADPENANMTRKTTTGRGKIKRYII